MARHEFQDAQGRTLEIDVPEGTMPTEQEVTQMFQQAYGTAAPELQSHEPVKEGWNVGDIGTTVANIPSDALNMAKNIVKAPFAIAKMVPAAVEGWKQILGSDHPLATYGEGASGIWEGIKQNWEDEGGLRGYITKHPVQALTDISLGLSALSAATKFAKAGELSNYLGETAKFIDPVRRMAQGIGVAAKGAGKGINYLSGELTGSGAEALNTAAQTGVKDTFLGKAMSGETAIQDIALKSAKELTDVGIRHTSRFHRFITALKGGDVPIDTSPIEQSFLERLEQLGAKITKTYPKLKTSFGEMTVEQFEALDGLDAATKAEMLKNLKPKISIVYPNESLERAAKTTQKALNALNSEGGVTIKGIDEFRDNLSRIVKAGTKKEGNVANDLLSPVIDTAKLVGEDAVPGYLKALAPHEATMNRLRETSSAIAKKPYQMRGMFRKLEKAGVDLNDLDPTGALRKEVSGALLSTWRPVAKAEELPGGFSHFYKMSPMAVLATMLFGGKVGAGAAMAAPLFSPKAMGYINRGVGDVGRFAGSIPINRYGYEAERLFNDLADIEQRYGDRYNGIF